MEKAKINQEQADKIKLWEWHTKYPSILLNLHVNNALVCNNCLQSLTLDELARAIYVGYEVEVEVKVGDWLVNNRNGMIFQIEDGLKDNLKDIVGAKHLRHATESEIVEEKGRYMGSKLDKILLDSSYTLNQEQAYKDLQEEKQLVEEECERYKKMFSEEKGKSITLYIENKRYKQALEFYENEGNYKTVIENDKEIKFLGTSLAQMDGGEVARKVLESSGNEGDLDE